MAGKSPVIFLNAQEFFPENDFITILILIYSQNYYLSFG